MTETKGQTAIADKPASGGERIEVMIADGITGSFPAGTPLDVIERTIKSNFPEIPQSRTSFAGREGYRYNKGRHTIVDQGLHNYRAMQSGDEQDWLDAQDFQDEMAERYNEKNDELYKPDNLGEKFVGATTELAPYLLSSTKEAILYGEVMGGAFATVAAVAGQAGPQALLPEEAATVPGAYFAGRSIGQAYGTFMNATKIEGGLLYGDLRRAGVEHGLSRDFATVGGSLIGLVEMFQVGQVFNRFLPAGIKYSRKGASRLIVDMVKKKPPGVVKNIVRGSQIFTGQMTLRTGLEIVEEEVQEVIGIVSEVGANLIQAAYDRTPYNGPDPAEMAERLKQTFTQGLLAFPLLGMPGSMHTATKQVGQRSRKIAAGRKVVEAGLPASETAEILNTIAVTVKGDRALTKQLFELVEEASNYDTMKDFTAKVKVNMNDKAAQSLGFDNVTGMLSAVYDRGQINKAELADEEALIKETAQEIEEELPLEVKEPEAKEKPVEGEAKEVAVGDTTFEFGENIREEREKEGELEPETEEELKIKWAEETILRADARQQFREEVGKFRRTRDLREEQKDISRSFFTTDRSAESMDEVAARLGMTQVELIDALKEFTVTDIGFQEKVKEAKQFLRKTEKKQKRAAKRQEIRQKAKEEKAGIEDLKTELINYIVDNLTLDKRGRKELFTKIKNVRTPKAFLEALDRVDELAAIEAKKLKISELAKLADRGKIAKMRPEFRDPIEKALEGLTFRNIGEKKATQLMQLAVALETDPDNMIPQTVISELKLLSQRPVVELSIPEIQQIIDSISHLIRLNELKNKLIIRGKLRDFMQMKDRALSNIAASSKKNPGDIDGMDSMAKEAEINFYQKIFEADSYNPELLTEILDGKDKDALYQALYEGIDQGVDRQLDFEHKAEDFFLKRLRGIDVRNWSGAFQKKKKDVEIITVELPGGKKLKMTKGDRVAFLLHARSPENRKHLTEGGFNFARTPAEGAIVLTESDLLAIVNSATAEEVTAANAISDYFNKVQKQEINKVAVYLLGHELARVDNYFPIRTNALDRFRDELIKQGKGMQVSLEGMGIFKQRINSGTAIIIDDAFTAAFKSIKQVSAYVGLAAPLRTAKSMLHDNEIQTAIIQSGRRQYLQNLENYLRRIEGDSVNMDNVDKLTQDWINKLDVSILGLNPFVMFKQPISYLGASTEMDMKYLATSFKWRASRAETAEIEKWHPQLRDRFKGNVTREMGEVANVGAEKKFFTGETSVSQKFMIGISKFDKAAITSIWRAVKKEVKDTNPDLKGDEYMQKVADRAWEVIRRTQPTFHIKDRSRIGMSRNTFIRLATKYSSQRNKNWMILRRGVERYNRSDKKPKDKAKLMQAIGLIAVISPMLLMGVDKLRDKIYDRDEKEKTFWDILMGFIKFNLGNIYFIGTAFDSLASHLKYGTYSGYDINDPLTQTFDEVIDSTAEILKTIEHLATGEVYTSGRFKGEEKWAVSAKRAVQDSVDVISRMKGIPLKNIRKLLRIDITKPEGEEDTGGRKFGG